VGERLRAERIGAGVYEAEAGVPIWPFHFHHGIEEWLYVIAGAPVLRDPAGERALAPGEIVRFPSGPAGAHTVKGPGRFVIFATGHHDEPWMLTGTPALRHPEGEADLAEGDLVCRPEGPAGARRLLNRSGAPARVLVLSTTGLPATFHYPDTGEWLLRNGPGQEEVVTRLPSVGRIPRKDVP